MDLTHTFTHFANEVARLAGRAWTFTICIALVALWAVSGPLFGFSDSWQLAINTTTTIVTFLMVFLIQNTQNRDNAALQAKLDELIRVTNAKNGYIGIEKLTDKELEDILQDFESEATPLGLKSRIIEAKAAEVRARGKKAPAKPGKKRAPSRRAKTAA